jgi:hypothetical protein
MMKVILTSGFLLLMCTFTCAQTCSVDIRFSESLESAGGNGNPVCGDNNQGTLSFFDVPYVAGRTVLAVYSATEQDADPPPEFGEPCAGGEDAGFDFAEGTIGGAWQTVAGADPDALGYPRVALLCNDSATNEGGTVLLHSHGASLGAPYNNEHMAGGLMVLDGIGCSDLVAVRTATQGVSVSPTVAAGSFFLGEHAPTLLVAVLAASVPDPQLGPSYAAWGPRPSGWPAPVISQSDHASLVVDSMWINAYASLVPSALGTYSAAQKMNNLKGNLGTKHTGAILAAFVGGRGCASRPGPPSGR